eukprot:m.166936 g.166936  ORF g.166936 m.166936 type:complete len:874 (-) comp31447_c0_seq1:212-2833(-)
MGKQQSDYSGGMKKARKYDIGETNIAGLGTPLEKAIREASAGHESAWKKVKKDKVGKMVWRIEKFLVVPWPRKKYGKFFNGDSYIILNTYKSKGGKGAIQNDIHFWIGSESTQDEYGTAAYKTVELDDFLEGRATQYRETEGNESRAFRKIFPHLTILEGGIESGFTHVEEDSYKKRLLHVKGGMNTVVRDVKIDWTSLNSGDSFILDTGKPVQEGGKNKEGFTDGNLLLVFHGASASPMEKVKASGLAQSIDDQRGGLPERETYHDGQSDAELKAWWDALGSRPPTGKSIMSAEEGGNDKDIVVGEKRLMQISDAGGKLTMKEVAKGDAITRQLLTSDDVFILDDGYEVMVWIGLKASVDERKQAMDYGQKYLNEHSDQSDKCITKLMEGGENEQFEQAFEVGVMSTARPGDGVKFTGNIDKIRGLQKTKDAALSVSASYAGSGGPGVAIDFDDLYKQPCADPKEWRGRTKPESTYSKERQEKQVGAYNATSGWVSSLSPQQRQQRQNKIENLEKKYIELGKDGGAVHHGASEVLVSEGAEGSIQVAHGFNATEDAEKLRAAMKGLGTKKEPIVKVLSGKTLGQRIAIRKAYEADVGRNLFKDIESEWLIGGNFERILKVLIRDPYERDASFIYKAMKGLRCDSTLVIEILCTQESKDLTRLAAQYAITYPEHTLTEDLKKEFSSDPEKLFVALVEGKRAAAGPVDLEAAKKDAEKLYEAGEKRMMGCDEDVFIEIFSTRSFGHIAAIGDAYPQFPKKKTNLGKAIKKRCSGTLKSALKAIFDVARDPTAYWTTRLHKALDGHMVGSHHSSLVRTIVSRAEADLQTIEALYASETGKALQDVIMHDTSRFYMKTLLSIVNGNKDSFNDDTEA